MMMMMMMMMTMMITIIMRVSSLMVTETGNSFPLTARTTFCLYKSIVDILTAECLVKYFIEELTAGYWGGSRFVPEEEKFIRTFFFFSTLLGCLTLLFKIQTKKKKES